MEGCGIRDELIAEAIEALVCKTIIRGFQSHPRLQKFLLHELLEGDHMKQLPAAALVVTVIVETLSSARHLDAVAPQPHVELQIPTPPAIPASVISGGGAENVPFALDDDWVPFRPTYGHTNLRAVLDISQDDVIAQPVNSVA